MVEKDNSHTWSDTFTTRIGEDQATDLDPTDAPAYKQDQYRLLRRLNTGEWKNRTMRDQEQVRRRDNMAILDSLASKVPLIDRQQERAERRLSELDLQEQGLPADAICFAIVAMVHNSDARVDLGHDSIYHPAKPEAKNPQHLASLADSLPHDQETLEQAFVVVYQETSAHD